MKLGELPKMGDPDRPVLGSVRGETGSSMEPHLKAGMKTYLEGSQLSRGVTESAPGA